MSAAQQRIAEVLFRCLSDWSGVKTGVRDTRRPTTLRDIAAVADVSPESVQQVADIFRAPGINFLMPPSDVPLTPDTRLDVTHESLLRHWGLLRRWLETESASAETYRRLEETARLWRDGKHGYLDPTELSSVLDWQRREPPNPAWAKRYGGDFALAMDFLKKSQQDQERRDQALKARRKGQQRQKVIFWAAVALCMGLAAAVFFAVRERQVNEDLAAKTEDLRKKNEAWIEKNGEWETEKAEKTIQLNRVKIFFPASLVDGQMVANPLRSLLVSAADYEFASGLNAKHETDKAGMDKAEETLRKALAIVGGLGDYGRQGHTAGVAVFDRENADKKWLVTNDSDKKKLLLWEIVPASAPPALPPRPAPPVELSFDDYPPRKMEIMGQWLVVQGNQGRFSVWNLATTRLDAKPVFETKERATGIPLISRHRNLLHVQAVGADNKPVTMLLDLHNPKPRSILLEVDKNVNLSNNMSFTPNGRWFTLIGADGRPLFWDLDSPTPGKSLPPAAMLAKPPAARWVMNGEFSDDERLVVSFNDGTVGIWKWHNNLWALDTKVQKLPIQLGGSNLYTDRLGLWAITVPKSGVNQAELFDLSKSLANDKECRTLLDGFSNVDLGSPHPIQVDPKGGWLLVRLKSPFPGNNGFFLWHLADPDAKPKFIRASGAARVGDFPSGEPARFSPDGRWLIIAGQTNYVQVWDLWSRTPFSFTALLRGHDANIADFQVSGDSRWLMSLGLDGTLRTWDLWNLSTSAEPTEIRNPAGLHTVAVTPNRHWLAVSRQDSTIHFWNVPKESKAIRKEGPEFPAFGKDQIASLQVSMDSRWILGYGMKKGVLWSLRDADKPKEYCRFPGIVGTVSQFVVDANGRWLAATTTDEAKAYLGSSIQLWSIPPAKGGSVPQAEPAKIPSENATGVAQGFDPSGKYLIRETGKGLEMLDLANLKAESNPEQKPLQMWVRPLVSADGTRAVVFKTSSRAEVWDLSALAERKPYQRPLPEKSTKNGPTNPTFPYDPFISATGRWLVMKSFNQDLRTFDGFKLWSLEKVTEPIHVPPEDHAERKASVPRLMLSSLDHRWLLTMENNKGTLWDLSANPPTRHILDVNMAMATFSPDSSWLVAGDDQTIHTWNLNAALAHRAIPAKDNKGVMDGAVALSPNGLHLAALGRDYLLRVWDLEKQTDPTVLYGHQVFFPFALLIAPDGSKVVSFDRDRDIIRVSTVSMAGYLELADRTVGRKLTDQERKQFLLQDK